MEQQQQHPDISRVTFAILCYNYGRYLRRAIESCLIQKAPGIQTEILVLDDGSTDKTPEICAKYEGRIRVSRSENMGLGATLTRAVQEANGEWIFFLDADDYFAPTKLTAFFPYLLPGMLFLSDLPRLVDADGKPFAPAKGSPKKELEEGCASTLAVFREAARDLLPVESELYFRVLARPGKNRVLKTAHTFYRIHGANMSNKHFPGVWNGYLASLTHRLADKLETMSKDPPTWLGTPQEVQSLAWDYRSRAWYNELEAALECHLPVRAWGRWCRMMLAAYRGKGITKFHWKMLAKTLLQEPSFSP